MTDMTAEDITRVMADAPSQITRHNRFLRRCIAREVSHRIATRAATDCLTTLEAAEQVARRLETEGFLFRPFDRTRVTIALHGAEARGDTMGGAMQAWVAAHLEDTP